jgi:predicted nucleic acid-binding protein
MCVLFDTNILLNALLVREPFWADAAFLLEAVEAGRIEGFLSATTLTDIHYLVGRQTRNSETAITAVIRLLELLEICPVDRGVLEQAITLGLPDFEDSVQVACALTSGLDVIVTRDTNGFRDCPVTTLSSADLRNRLVTD